MKVAQVLLRYDAPGGVETHVRELARELTRAGDEVRVYASDLFSEDGWVRRPEASRSVDGIPVERFPAVKRLIPGLTLPLLPGLVGALDRDAPELIHAHSHRYGHVLEAALVASARDIPFVVTAHYHPADPWEPPMKKGLLRVQDYVFGATAYRAAGALIAQTKLEARALGEFAPAQRIRIIPPGIDLDAWATLPGPASARERTGLPEGYLLFAGRLARNKGLGTLLEAWAGLPAPTRPLLVLCGQDWGVRSGLETRARTLGVSDRIRFLGHPDDPTYRAVFAGAAALVLPSDYESFGLVLLEAMAAGLPVISTRVGGIPEVVEEGRTALLVPSGNVPALRAALSAVLADPKRARELGAAGRARVEERFSWRRTADSVRQVYRELTGGPG
jgi:glycogen synthase